MAKKCDCKVSLKKFKHSVAGYQQVMNSAPIQRGICSAADSAVSAANAMLSDDGHDRAGFGKKIIHGKLADGYLVHPQTDHAVYADAKHDILIKARRAAKC